MATNTDTVAYAPPICSGSQVMDFYDITTVINAGE